MLSLFLQLAVLNYKLRDQLHWLLLLTSVGRSSADPLFGMLEGKPLEKGVDLSMPNTLVV